MFPDIPLGGSSTSSARVSPKNVMTGPLAAIVTDGVGLIVRVRVGVGPLSCVAVGVRVRVRVGVGAETVAVRVGVGVAPVGVGGGVGVGPVAGGADSVAVRVGVGGRGVKVPGGGPLATCRIMCCTGPMRPEWSRICTLMRVSPSGNPISELTERQNCTRLDGTTKLGCPNASCVQVPL